MNCKKLNRSKRKTDYELGAFFHEAIRESGKTYQQIAEEIDVSRESVSMYCCGKRKPGQRTLLKLIKAANVRPENIPF